MYNTNKSYLNSSSSGSHFELQYPKIRLLSALQKQVGGKAGGDSGRSKLTELNIICPIRSIKSTIRTKTLLHLWDNVTHILRNVRVLDIVKTAKLFPELGQNFCK